MFCLPCVLFPDTSHRRPKKLISEPYQNWKNALEDLKKHSTYDYHQNSVVKYKSFISTNLDPSRRVDISIHDNRELTLRQNRLILRSILTCLEFCGRQGIALRGHRDDGYVFNPPDDKADITDNEGNFRGLLRLRVDSGDNVLETHLSKCRRNASYISKTSQNDFLCCIKDFLQDHIVNEIKNQVDGPYFGFQCDEVTDSSNWEQLGIVVRYVKNNKPVERLISFIPCETITGEAICQQLISCFQDVGLDPTMCRAMTLDGAGNMAGRQRGCAACFNRLYPKAIHHYCSSHDLNLALCKSCEVKEIHLMLDSIKQLGIFLSTHRNGAED